MPVSGVVLRRIVWAAILAVVLFGLWWTWTTWAAPDVDERDAAIEAACVDAAHLHSAGLLDEASAAYARIADVGFQAPCASERFLVENDDQASATAAERGAVYFAAAQIKRGGDRAKVLSRAQNAYIEALSLDPYAVDARRRLAALIAVMDVPMTGAVANARCAFADRLRNIRMFGLARDAYAKAVRAGRSSECKRFGMRAIREDSGIAVWIARRAGTLNKTGRPDEARARYIAALAWNPMTPGARTALATIDAPDPNDGTTSGHLLDVADSAGATVGHVGDAATWVKDNSDALAFGAVVVIIAVPILMWLLYGLTVTRRGRRIVGLVHVPRFARKQLTVTGFTPEDKASTARAVFQYWLTRRPADPHAAADATFRDSIDEDTATDAWSAPEVSAAADLETLFADTAAAGFVAAALRLVQRVVPNREVRFSGELLDRSASGPGLRVVATRRFRAPRDKIWWAGEFPSIPTEEEAEAEARHALVIIAATWAHEQFAE